MSNTIIITSISELENEIRDIKTLEAKERELKELREEKEALVKKALEEAGVNEMSIGTFVVRNRLVTRNNFCASEFKKKYLELYNAFIRQTFHYKFTIS